MHYIFTSSISNSTSILFVGILFVVLSFTEVIFKLKNEMVRRGKNSAVFLLAILRFVLCPSSLLSLSSWEENLTGFTVALLIGFVEDFCLGGLKFFFSLF